MTNDEPRRENDRTQRIVKERMREIKELKRRGDEARAKRRAQELIEWLGWNDR